MKKILFFLFAIIFPSYFWAQAVEIDGPKTIPVRSVKESFVFKPTQLSSSKEESVEVTGLGNPVFLVSNIGDGTEKSFQHTLRVSYSLQLASNKSGYSLIFYGQGESIPYSVQTEGTTTSIYFPYVAHEQIKSKLDQAFAARKKVQLRISQKTDGFREAVFVF